MILKKIKLLISLFLICGISNAMEHNALFKTVKEEEKSVLDSTTYDVRSQVSVDLQQTQYISVAAQAAVPSKRLLITTGVSYLDVSPSRQLEINMCDKVALGHILQNPESSSVLLSDVSKSQMLFEGILKGDVSSIYDLFEFRFSWMPWDEDLTKLKKELESILCKDGVPLRLDKDGIELYKAAKLIEIFFDGIITKEAAIRWIERKALEIPAFKFLAEHTKPKEDLLMGPKRLMTWLTSRQEESKFSIATHSLTKDRQLVKALVAEGKIEEALGIYQRYCRAMKHDGTGHREKEIIAGTLDTAFNEHKKRLYAGPYTTDPYFAEVHKKLEQNRGWERKGTILSEESKVLHARHSARKELLQHLGNPKDISPVANLLTYKLIDCNGNTGKIAQTLSVLSSDDQNPAVQEAYKLFCTPEGLPKVGQFNYQVVKENSMPAIGLQKNWEQRITLAKLCAAVPTTEQDRMARAYALDFVRKSCVDGAFKRDYLDLAQIVRTTITDPKADRTMLGCPHLLKKAGSDLLAEAQLQIPEIVQITGKLSDRALPLTERTELQQKLLQLEANEAEVVVARAAKKISVIPEQIDSEPAVVYALDSSCDFVSTTPTRVIDISPEIDARIEQVLRELQEQYPDFTEYMAATDTVLREMKEKGLLDPDTADKELREAIIEGLCHYFEELKPSNPLEHPKEFMINTAKYVASSAISIVGGNKVSQVQKVFAIGSQLNELSKVDTVNLTRKELARLIAEQAADLTKMVLWDRVVRKALPAVKQLYATQKVPAAVTPEGIVVEGKQEINPKLSKDIAQDAGILEKAKNTINETSEATLKDGYYEVNGFKFTEYYYNKLWKSGRGAPSLISKEILDNAKIIVPDKFQGFFRYEFGQWEMVYNPSTKEVYHLAPLKRLTS